MTFKISANLLFKDPEQKNVDAHVDLTFWEPKLDQTVGDDNAFHLKDVSKKLGAINKPNTDKLKRLLNKESMCIKCSINQSKHTQGCTLFDTRYIKKCIDKQEALLIKHWCNTDCVALVWISQTEGDLLDGTKEAHNYNTNQCIRMVRETNLLSAKICEVFKINVQFAAKSLHYAEAFFPEECGGRSFVNLNTLMPCTLMDTQPVRGTEHSKLFKTPEQICFPMPLLQHCLESPTNVLPIQWILYNIYGACLLTKTNFSKIDTRATAYKTVFETIEKGTEFMEAFCTMSMSDFDFNTYTSDETIVGMKKMVSSLNQDVYVFVTQLTEAIQRSPAQFKKAPDDCEDWAQFIFLTVYSLLQHCRTLNWDQKDEFFKCTIFAQLNENDRTGLLNLCECLAHCIHKGEIRVDMVCGIAGQPSLSDKSKGGPAGGHEFCVLNVKLDGKESVTILEGTNWVKCTLFDQKQIEKLDNELKTRLQSEYDIDPENPGGVRVRGLQHVEKYGQSRENVDKFFWRTLIARGDELLISVDENQNVTQYGCNLRDVLQNQNFLTISFLECMRNMVGREQVHHPDIIENFKKLYQAVNEPPMSDAIFLKIAEKWGKACSFNKLPQIFQDSEVTSQPPNLFGYFFAYPKKKSGTSVPFMTQHIYKADLPIT